MPRGREGRRGRAEERSRIAVVAKRGRFLVGELLFDRGPRLALSGGKRVRPGELALVEPSGRGARVLRSAGRPDKARDVIEALLLDRGFRRGFADPVERRAEKAALEADFRAEPRQDLSGLPTFTVDPATARDFDDAVSAEEEGDGVRLWIHIADVAAHVRPDDALDREARGRGNSTYAPGTVEPMLPLALSANACSLNPGVERLAVTAEIELSADGRPRSERFYRSRIRSDARLDYDQLDHVFAGRERAPQQVAEPIALARRAAAALANRRGATALEVERVEPEFEFEHGDVVAARSVRQTEAHALIEQLMILTNERVAELLERKRAPTLYRVHEEPDPDAVERLLEKLAALEIPTPPLPDQLGPRQAGELARKASRLAVREAERRGHGREAYTSLVLRSLKQAHYSDRNLGHAGLASSAYVHFTSPIRRYPDLVAHRGLLAAIGAEEQAPSAELAAAVAPESSEREQQSARLERDADDVCLAFLLERELFQRGSEARFEGEVSGLIGAGAFVRFEGELSDTYEGFLPARRIGGRERYELDETETRLAGSRGGPVLRLGDPLRVRVDRVEAPRGRVDLLPEAEAEP